MTSLPFTLHTALQRAKLIERAARNFPRRAATATLSLKTVNYSTLNAHNTHLLQGNSVANRWKGCFNNGRGLNSIIRGDVLLMVRNCRSLSGGGGGGDEENTCEKCTHVYTRGGEGRMDFVKAVSCPKCGALQRISVSGLPTYFEILGLEKSYLVDVQGISNKAKQLQKRLHPDLYSQKGDDQQHLSQEYSSLINKAVSTIVDPISRGRYMLALSGFSSDDPDLEKSMTNDPEFLEEVMELNERLEEITSEKNWKEFRSENVDTMKLIHLGLEKAFEEDNMKEAQRLLGRMKYFDTLQHKLKEVQSKIGIVE